MLRIITEEEKKKLVEEITKRIEDPRKYIYGNSFVDPKLFPILHAIKNRKIIIDSDTIDILCSSSTHYHRDFADRYYDVFEMLNKLLHSDDKDHHQLAFDFIIQKMDFLINSLNFGDFKDNASLYTDSSQLKEKAKEYIFLKLDLSDDVSVDLKDSVKLLIKLH